MNKADLEKLVDALKQKALHEQLLRRRYQQQAIELASRLAIYEPGDDQ